MSTQYEAFLLRLRRPKKESQWRVTLINVHSNEQIHLSSEEALFLYLKQILHQKDPVEHRGNIDENGPPDP